jgi:HEAT repeat protein
LQSPDRRQRLGAIEGLGALGQPEVLPDLVRLLSGADAEFEAALQRAIARIAANPVPASAPQRPFVEPEPSGEGQGEDGEAAGSDE